MMANDERKLATSSLIPLEIDPVSILSLSKGVIFDTIVHNIEYTLNNRRTDPLPWKLIGMSLICDPSRNKKYMQKLQRMQCVPSVICTQIYHSKLIKTDSNVLTTPGKKIALPTCPRTRLTGIIVCRSIDELLYMESANTENVHFIQYKLLSYERIATRELVNGPKLVSIGDKIIKTVFDFELTQNNGFPRQLLPVAIISFARQEGCDLSSSIRHFLTLDEHKTFDKSYLVTSINVELDRLREEQERKEDAEAEQELLLEKTQPRQPLADLSKKSTDTGNARPSSISEQQPARVAPIKLKLNRPDKPVKPSVPTVSIERKFQCFLKLDRIDLSSYDISNLPDPSEIKIKISKPASTSPTLISNKTKSLSITKPFEHQKPLKRLNHSEPKKSSLFPTEILKKKRNNDSISIRSSTSDISILSLKNKKHLTSPSISSISPIYQPKPIVQRPQVEKITTKKKVKRPILPSEYKCSLPLMRIDLSIYDLDLPPIPSSTKPLPMDTESIVTSSSISFKKPVESNNLSVESENIPIISLMEQENVLEPEIENIFETEQFIDTNTNKNLSNIVEEFSTPDLNGPESDTTNDVLPVLIDEVLSTPTKEIITEVITEETANKAVSTIINDDEKTKLIPPTSPDILPILDDDPVLFSIENSQIVDTTPEDCIIIVPCSDDDEEDDDIDDEDLINDIKNSIIANNIDTKIIESSSSLTSVNNSPVLRNPSLTRILLNNRLESPRLSTSSSCSSISVSIFHHQSPGLSLDLTKIFLSQKILNKKKPKTTETICFNRYDITIPLFAQEPLIDPRLIYRLQSITTDLRWPSPCTQCSISPYLPSLFTSSTQTILYDRNNPLDFVDPRRDSLKTAILNTIYQRINIIIPNIFIMNTNQFQKFLFEQTIFKTNCSLHLEYLLHNLKITDDKNFLQMIQTTNEFQLSPFLLQLIFN